ncbi:MAG: Uma2 family endonuclease [Solirubrobacterales bacterium]
MSATATKITADQYYAQTVEGDRKQLVEGEIIVNEPKLIHGELQARLLVALRSWTASGPDRGQAFLPTDVRINRHNVYGPDLLWFRDGRVPQDLDAYPEDLPDLCVEIRSKSTWRYDVGAKKRVYEAAGLPELWLVDDAAEIVLVYRRSVPDAATFDVALEARRSEMLASPYMPDFGLSVDDLFTLES